MVLRDLILSLSFLFFFSSTVHDTSDILLDLSQKLIEKFHYPWEMMPLLYVILKYANGDIEEASRELYEGMNGSAFPGCSLNAFTELWFAICCERVRHIWSQKKNNNQKTTTNTYKKSQILYTQVKV